MGRHKKVMLEPTAEGIDYTLRAINGYPKMRQFCDEFEKRYPSLLQKGNINAEAFNDMECLSTDTFIMPDLAPCDSGLINEYLEKREKVYLLEYGVKKLNTNIRPIAENLFIQRLTWEDVMKKHSISRMTVCRIRKAAINEIAYVVDSYMIWKVQKVFL